jgi:hypothetical protein
MVDNNNRTWRRLAELSDGIIYGGLKTTRDSITSWESIEVDFDREGGARIFRLPGHRSGTIILTEAYI